MFTWRLWNALEHPFTQHPMFVRYIHKTKRVVPIRVGDVIILPNVFGNVSRIPWGMIIFVIVLAFICSGQWFLLFPLALLSPLLFLSVGVLYGSSNATVISTTLTTTRLYGQYDLLSVTPLGRAGFGWAIVSAVYHSRQSLKQLKNTTRTIYGIAIVVLVLYIMFNLVSLVLFQTETDLVRGIIADTIPTLLFVLGLYIDLIQSTILGCIMGLLVPTYANSHFDAKAISLALFMTLEVLFYGGFVIIAFWILPHVIEWKYDYLLGFARFVIFVLMRDVLMLFLWRMIAWRTSTDVDELNMIIEMQR